MGTIGGYATEEDVSPRPSALICVSTQEDARLYEPPLTLPWQGGRLDLVEDLVQEITSAVRSKESRYITPGNEISLSLPLPPALTFFWLLCSFCHSSVMDY